MFCVLGMYRLQFNCMVVPVHRRATCNRRVEKEYTSKAQVVTAALDKAEDTYKKEMEKLVLRKDDLDKQLESMLDKLKVGAAVADSPEITVPRRFK